MVRRLLVSTLFALGALGCSSSSPSLREDPLTSNLLTPPPSKTEPKPAYAAAEPHADPMYSPGSSYSSGATNASSRPSSGGNVKLVSSKSHDADYRWLKGRLRHEDGKNGGWYIEYATGAEAEADRYGGRLRFANSPRLDLLRVGDLVQVDGEVIQHNPGDPRFHVETIDLVSQ